MLKDPLSKFASETHTSVQTLGCVRPNTGYVGSEKSLKYIFSLYKTTQDETDYTVVSLNRTATDLVAKNTL